MTPAKARIGSPSFFSIFFIILTFSEGYSHSLSTILDERGYGWVQSAGPSTFAQSSRLMKEIVDTVPGSILKTLAK
jgi:hypothetical protein